MTASNGPTGVIVADISLSIAFCSCFGYSLRHLGTVLLRQATQDGSWH